MTCPVLKKKMKWITLIITRASEDYFKGLFLKKKKNKWSNRFQKRTIFKTVCNKVIHRNQHCDFIQIILYSSLIFVDDMSLHVVQDRKIKYKVQKMRDKLLNSGRCHCLII